jgi:hypothetical protein
LFFPYFMIHINTENKNRPTHFVLIVGQSLYEKYFWDWEAIGVSPVSLLLYFVTLLFCPLHQSGKDLSLLLKLSKVGAPWGFFYSCPAIFEVPLYLIIDRTSDSCEYIDHSYSEAPSTPPSQDPWPEVGDCSSAVNF